ncbi:MAG: FBP domain-containing protein [Candidatus Microbacterium stercoravium]|uniref:FBP domain-containing protein n=1 Tax=Candidatus Microbacterium stercoravium TaxID=2838697 RepID=A0A9D2H6Z5_9MICO|nr:FBP domain-containing protein [Candidatus Microbacterium stercoravium]
MRTLDAAQIRAAFTNVSLRERKAVALPDLDAVPWDAIDYLGWRDPKMPLVGYVVTLVDDEPVGFRMRQAEQTPRHRAQCVWCADVTLPNDVVMFSTKRAGAAGRRGDTVGTYVCAQFECNRNARATPRTAYLGFDVEAARQARIIAFRENVQRFAREVIATA